jgi:phosphoribosyl 1,2-cyclic phosphodiesterase
MTFEVGPVDHSVIAPAVGYRITAGGATVFYVPDVLRIRDRRAALNGVRLYVGDGAAVVRAIVRIERQRGAPVGHAPIATQLDWCAEAGVAHAIFTHCGRAIVTESSVVIAQISAAGRARQVTAHVAHDGFEAMVRNHGSHYEEH